MKYFKITIMFGMILIVQYLIFAIYYSPSKEYLKLGKEVSNIITESINKACDDYE